MALNTTDLILRVRRNAFIRDNHPDYTDAIIIDELNDALRSIYLDIMTGPRQGFWLKQFVFTQPSGGESFQVPKRAVVSGLEKVEIGEIGGPMWTLAEVTENHAGWYESFAGRTGMPQYFVMRGETVEFLPTPDHAISVRVSYYQMPSFLVPVQTVANAGFVSFGDNTAHTITLAGGITAPTFQTNYSAGASPGGAIASSGLFIDVVRPYGTCETIVYSAQIGVYSAGPPIVYTILASTFTGDVSQVRFKDFVRGEGESEYPSIPEEFHRTVADTASVKIMLELNMASKASTLAQSCGGDLERLRTLMSVSRTRNSPKTIGLSMITFGGGRRVYPRFP